MTYSNMVDGGIIANNPAIIGYMEAIHALNVKPEDLAILSLGTGNNLISDMPQTLAARYWLYKGKLLRLYDLFSSAQADYTSNMMKFFQKGIGTSGEPQFVYDRLQYSFSNNDEVNMDDSSPQSLRHLEGIGQKLFGDHATKLMKTYFQNIKDPFEPNIKL